MDVESPGTALVMAEKLAQIVRAEDNDPTLTVGRLDSRYRGVDRTDAGERYDYDPALTAWNHAFTPAINQYLREQLDYETDLQYWIFGPVNPWNRSGDTTGEDLRAAMAENPFLHLFVQSGYFDGGTDYFGAKYTMWNMDPAGRLRDRMRFQAYRSGARFNGNNLVFGMFRKPRIQHELVERGEQSEHRDDRNEQLTQAARQRRTPLGHESSRQVVVGPPLSEPRPSSSSRRGVGGPRMGCHADPRERGRRPDRAAGRLPSGGPGKTCMGAKAGADVGTVRTRSRGRGPPSGLSRG